jgi:hypothetical protein
MKSQPKSDNAAPKKPTLFIPAGDPRLKTPLAQANAYSKSNAEVQGLINLNQQYLSLSALSSAALANITLASTPSSSQILYPPVGTTLPLITNLTAAWSSKNLVLTFTFDTTDPNSSNFFGYQIQVYDGSIWWPFANKIVPSQSTGQVWTISSTDQINWTLTVPTSLIAQTGIPNPTSITQVEIEPVDANFLSPGYTVATITNGYTSDLPAPIISVTPKTDSYVVTTTNFSTASAISDFNAEIIEEYVTTITDVSQIPTDAGSPWVIVNQNAKTSPIGISAPDEAHRWVRTRFQAKDASFSPYSNLVDVTPTVFMPPNTYPPVMVSNVNAQWAALGVANSSGNDILISYTQPSAGSIDSVHTAPQTVKVKLVPIINGSPSTTYSGYFYHKFSSSSDSSFVISQQDLYNNFSKYYNAFTAYVSTLSAVGVESTTNYQVNAFTRSNPLASIVPVPGTPNANNPDGVFRVVGITNGYTVDWDLPTTATYAEIYESTLPWKLGGGTGYTTFPPTDDTLVSYAGASPAVIQTIDYNPRYILIRYYDQYDNYSQYNDITATGEVGGVLVGPVDIGRNSLINNPIKISTDGSIFSGAGDSTVFPQVYFNKDGLFAYDASGNWTTEIINNASTDASTFITKRAQIADWRISPSAIESVKIPGTITTYTGFSASNPNYAFWAGSSQSQNSTGDAPFYVTPTGSVHATNISISGTGAAGTYLITANGTGNFSVTQDGVLTAHAANITGILHVGDTSTFDGNIFVGTGGRITAGASQATGPSVQIDYTGLSAYDNSSLHVPTTKIYGNATGSGNTFFTQAAQIGGWLVNATQINSSNSNISLDSSNETITVLAPDNSAYGLKFTAVSTSSSSFLISAGNFSNPAFSVTSGGILTANGANISGALNVTDHIKIGSKTAIGDYTNPGGWINSAGTFLLGTSNAYIQSDQTSVAKNIYLTTNYQRTANANAAYNGYSQIVLGTGGTQIYGIPIQGDIDLTQTNTYYRNQYPLGPYPRQRTLVEDPVSGQTLLGMAVYYGTNTTPVSGGYVGDLWVIY